MKMKMEIKFRGLRTDGGGWVYGWLFKDKNDFWMQDYKHHALSYIVTTETIGQFTGLKDKNGVEIYEGDIFDINQTVNGCSKFVILSCIGGYDVRYYYENIPQREYEYSIYELLEIGVNDKEIEIVGNIHEKC